VKLAYNKHPLYNVGLFVVSKVIISTLIKGKMYIWRFNVLSHIQVFVELEFGISKIYCLLYPKYTVIQAIPVFVAFHKCVV